MLLYLAVPGHFTFAARCQLMDSPNHKAYHVDEYIPRNIKGPSPTSAYGKGSGMYNDGRPGGNSMYVMVPVPLPMGQQQAGYGWNGPSFPVNHPSYSGPDWDNGHASSSRAALMPQRSTHSYRSHHERRYRKNCCSCWRCAVASVIILAFIGVGTAVAGIVFLKMLRENAEPAIVAAPARNGTLTGTAAAPGSGDAISFDIIVASSANGTIVAVPDGNANIAIAPSVTSSTEQSPEIAGSLLIWINETGTPKVMSAADVDLRSADGGPSAVGIIVPANSNVTVEVPSRDAKGEFREGVGAAPLTATISSVGAADIDATTVQTTSDINRTMPPTPAAGVGFVAEVVGAAPSNLFTSSPTSLGLTPIMMLLLENSTMSTNGRIDVPNAVSAVTRNPAEVRNTTFLGARAFHHPQRLTTSTVKPR